MQIDRNWAIGLVGGILGLFSLELPWVGIILQAKPLASHTVGIGPVDLFNLNWITSGDSMMALNGSLGLMTSLLFIALVVFISGCFLSMVGRRGCWFMLGGNLTAFVIILGSPLFGATIIVFPHYGGIIGFAAGVVSFAGLPSLNDLSHLSGIQRQIVGLSVDMPGIRVVEIASILNEEQRDVNHNVKALASKGFVAVEMTRNGSSVFASPGLLGRVRRDVEVSRENANQASER